MEWHEMAWNEMKSNDICTYIYMIYVYIYMNMYIHHTNYDMQHILLPYPNVLGKDLGRWGRVDLASCLRRISWGKHSIGSCTTSCRGVVLARTIPLETYSWNVDGMEVSGNQRNDRSWIWVLYRVRELAAIFLKPWPLSCRSCVFFLNLVFAFWSKGFHAS